jgi:hypothetical protein
MYQLRDGQTYHMVAHIATKFLPSISHPSLKMTVQATIEIALIKHQIALAGYLNLSSCLVVVLRYSPACGAMPFNAMLKKNGIRIGKTMPTVLI